MKKTIYTTVILLLMGATACIAAQENEKEINPSEYTETYIGDVVTDAMLNAMGADAAFINGGSLGYEDLPDKVTPKTLPAIVPFATDKVVNVKMKGEAILSVLEKSVSLYPRRSSSFLQVAGITFKCDPNNKPGNRVFDVGVRGKNIVADREYIVAVTDFLASGGGGMTAFRKCEPVEREPLPLDEVILKNIDYNKKLVGKPAGRIIILPLKEEK